MSEWPSGTVTFVFTDLEDSTRLWDEHPDEMRTALARHDAILRDAVAAHDGMVVKSTGDGAYAVFGNADRAQSPQWMQKFAVFSLPRPWPLWMARLPPEEGPIDPVYASVLLLAITALGAGLLAAGTRDPR